MQRSNPFWNLAGLVGTGVLLAGLAAALLLTGGLAFSPGPLSAQTGSGADLGGYPSHAAFERRCELCHQPLALPMSQLCQACHTNVAAQIQAQSGLHGKINPSTRCRDCHPDHAGRDFSPARAALSHFDHQLTHFNLIHHPVDFAAAPMECAACHDPQDAQFAVRVERCYDCHAADKPEWMAAHQADFGAACLDCHDGADKMSGFEHGSTGFPLEGKHAAVACQDCHTAAAGTGMARFGGLAAACSSCHAEPAMHAGIFSTACADCHTPAGWSPANLDGQSFDHAALGFSLEKHTQGYDGTSLTCRSCHTQELAQFVLQVCIDCHAQKDAIWMEGHRAKVGEACLACHDGVDRMIGFDHNQVFVLDGRHVEIACLACHGVDPAHVVFRGLPGRCVDCHAEPEIHAGFFGLECEQCHATTAWSPAFLKEHAFPLDHGANAPSQCALCHPAVFTEYTCYGCHEHNQAQITAKHAEERISGQRLENCMECHPDGRKGDD